MDENQPKQPGHQDPFTASVARLHRAGATNSKSNTKLAQAIVQLIAWIRENVPHDLHHNLPDGCRLFPSGEFTNSGKYPGTTHVLLEKDFFNFTQLNLNQPEAFDLRFMTAFAELIASGWLGRLSKMLEDYAVRFDEASGTIEAFMGSKA